MRQERRRTLGDWVAVCPACGHGRRYVESAEASLPAACPTCGTALRVRCPGCEARIASMFAVACEECGEPLRPPAGLGAAVRRER